MRKNFLFWVEKQAQILRTKLSLSPLDNLDPFELAKSLKIVVLTPYDILGLSVDIQNQLLDVDSDGWSAGTICLPNGKKIVVMNPRHAMTRQRITLMEEIAHIFLRHEPTILKDINNSLALRDYKENCEKEAYWIGAASLLPRSVLFHAQKNNIAKSTLGKQYTVSEKLITFRENITHIKLTW
jgi:Zn-dependent peptidase ImmA (M78 family)